MDQAVLVDARQLVEYPEWVAGEVLPSLSATFLTSVVGVAPYSVMASAGAAAATPDYRLGLWLGSAGLIGGAIGARLQTRLPERGLRRELGALAVCLAIGYLVAAIAR